MLLKVIDYQGRGASGVQPRPVFINTHYIVAMEPWGQKFKVYVGRSLEYVVRADDAERLGRAAFSAAPRDVHEDVARAQHGVTDDTQI